MTSERGLKQRIISSGEKFFADANACRGNVEASPFALFAEERCKEKLESVLSVVRKHTRSNAFAYEGSLIRDGVFFAAYMLADSRSSSDELESCLTALRQCRWAFCKSDEREQTLQHMRENQAAAVELPFAKMEETASPPLGYGTSHHRRGQLASESKRTGGGGFSGRMVHTSTGGEISPVISSPSGLSRPSRPPSHGSVVSLESTSSRRGMPSRAAAVSTGSPQMEIAGDGLSLVTSFPVSLSYGEDVGTQTRFGISSSVPETPMSATATEFGSTTYYYEPTASLSRLGGHMVPSAEQETSYHQGQGNTSEYSTGNFSVDYY